MAVLCFAAGLVWSLWTLPETSEFVWWPLAILLILGVPLMTVVNAAEFLVMSRMAGAHVGWSASLETTIYASAANLLPLPGGVIVRIVALKAQGATVRIGSLITAVFAGIWGGAAFVYSGSWLWVLGHEALGGMLAIAGVGLLGISVLAALRLQTRKSLVARAIAIRIAALLIDVLRQMLAIWSLGAMVGFGEASIFAVSSFVGNAVSIIPAGLGVRELVAAALSPLIALPPAVGFLSAAVNRITGMVGLAAISAILLIRRRNAL